MSNKELLLNDIKENKPIIIICDTDYHDLLVKFKTENYRSANIKFISYQQAISMISFEVTPQMITLLMKQKGYGYIKAKEILMLIRVLGAKRIKDAPFILKESYDLVKDLLKQENYDNSFIFKNKSIYLFNRTKDIQLANLFKDKGLSFKHISFEDLDINTKFPKEVYEFDNKFEQYMFVFSDVKKLLTNDPKSNKKIRIVVKDEFDLYYLQYFSSLFNIDVYANLELSLGHQTTVIKAMNAFYNAKSIDTKLIVDSDPGSHALKDIISRYELDAFEFQKAYLILQEIVSQTTYTDNTLINKGIICTNQFHFDIELITYVLSFQDEIFWQSFSDTEVISDEEKLRLGINPSYINTLLDKQRKASYVKFNNIILLSRVKQHLDEHIYDSGLVNELNLTKVNFSLTNPEKVNELLTHSYTSEAAYTLASILKERNYDISKYPHVEQYDYQTDGIKIKPKERYSITDIQEYNKCPFKYLLDRIYHLDSDDNKYYANLGTLLHFVMQHIQDKDFNFDKLYKEGIEIFKAKMEKDSNGQYDCKYDVFVQIIKPWFKHFVDSYRFRLAELASNNVKILPEVEFDFSIPESEYKFKGKADAIVLSQIGNEKYYSIFDYKSGSDVFEPLSVCIGQNLQLPLYFAGLKHSNQADLVKDCNQGGFGLKKILGSSIKKFSKDNYISEKTINAFSMVALYSNNNENFIKTLSIFGLNKKNKPTKKGVEQLISPRGNTKKFADAKVAFTIQDLCNHAQNAAIETLGHFALSEYPIYVTANTGNILANAYELDKDDTNCKYCKHCDICYRKNIADSYYDQSNKVREAWKSLIVSEKGEDNE